MIPFITFWKGQIRTTVIKTAITRDPVHGSGGIATCTGLFVCVKKKKLFYVMLHWWVHDTVHLPKHFNFIAQIVKLNVFIFYFLIFSCFWSFFLILFFNFTILYWFCHIPKWIHHRYTCIPHPEPSSHLPLHTIPLGRPSAPAPSIQYRASNLEWRLVSYMILYMFQCHSPKSSHPLPLPQSPKDCAIHQCLFCCLVYRVIVTIFLNSIYMR